MAGPNVISNYEMLVRNTAAYANVSPVHAALWSKNTLLDIENAGAEKNAFRLDSQRRSGSDGIQGLTPVDILGLSAFPRIDIFKLDIEGAEKELFSEDSSAWLDRTDVIIIELHDWFRSGCGMAFYQAITPYRFCQVNRGENVFVRLGNKGFGAGAGV